MNKQIHAGLFLLCSLLTAEIFAQPENSVNFSDSIIFKRDKA